MSRENLRWLYLFILSLIWGSSFILMKKALLNLSPIQVGALRTVITTVFLLLIGFKSLVKIKKRHWKYLMVTGFLGTFFPAFLFAFAIEKIDSSIASILNGLTPLNTLILGTLFFGFGFRKKQLIGVFIGLLGTVVLILKGAEINPSHDYFYASFILMASLGYAINVNVLKRYLGDIDALSITVGSFVLIVIPALIVLWETRFFHSFQATSSTLTGVFYVSILSVFGTGIAKIIFNRLIQISTPIFSASVTYLIPIVAISWGILDGERISIVQFFAGFIILFGVYLVNKTHNKKPMPDSIIEESNIT